MWKHPGIKLMFEQLENRLVPSGINNWIGAAAPFDFNAAGNWSLGHVPSVTNQDNATFDGSVNNSACELFNSNEVYNMTIKNGYNSRIWFEAPNLNFSVANSFFEDAVSMNGKNTKFDLTYAKDNCTFTFLSGSNSTITDFNVSGNPGKFAQFQVENGGVLTVADGVVTNDSGCINVLWVIDGQVNWVANKHAVTFIARSDTPDMDIQITSNGSLTVQPLNRKIIYNFAGHGDIENLGTFTYAGSAGGSATTEINVPFDNAGNTYLTGGGSSGSPTIYFSGADSNNTTVKGVGYQQESFNPAAATILSQGINVKLSGSTFGGFSESGYVQFGGHFYIEDATVCNISDPSVPGGNTTDTLLNFQGGDVNLNRGGVAGVYGTLVVLNGNVDFRGTDWIVHLNPQNNVSDEIEVNFLAGFSVGGFNLIINASYGQGTPNGNATWAIFDGGGQATVTCEVSYNGPNGTSWNDPNITRP